MKRPDNLKGAQSDARKTVTEVPHVTLKSSAYSADTEACVVEAEPVLEQEQLADGHGQVGQLDKQVRDGQVVAVALTADQTAVAGQSRQRTAAAGVASLTLRQQVSVNLPLHRCI